MSEFNVQVGEFHGPLGHLLELVEKRKVPIRSLSLAHLTNEFVVYVRAQPKRSTLEMAEFVRIVSTLLLIKGQTLLPRRPLKDEEQEEVSNLEQRLALLRIYRDAAHALHSWEIRTIPLMTPRAVKLHPQTFTPGPGLTVAELHASMQGLVSELPQQELMPESTINEVVCIEDVIKRLMNTIQSTPITLTSLAQERDELLVTFLALLELVKDGEVAAEQREGDISLMRVDTVS